MKRTRYEVPRKANSTYMETSRVYTDGKEFFIRLNKEYKSIKGLPCEAYLPKYAYDEYIKG